MFTKTLLPDTFRAIKLVSKIKTVKDSYLAGGTALALQLGHRISVDLDFFNGTKFVENSLSQELLELPEFTKEGSSWQTIWGKIGKTKFSFFYYKYPLIEKTLNFESIRLADKKDIAAMKIHAIEERGTKRDFIDVYFLSQEFSIDEMLNLYQKKYGVLNEHLYSIIRALSYFEDADREIMPKMIQETDWESVRSFFQKEALRLGKKHLRK